MEPIRNTRSQIGRNAPCPCGSKKKFKNCCYIKQQPPRVSAEQLEKTRKARQRPLMSREMLYDEQLTEFRQRFGREPRQIDQVYFSTPDMGVLLDQIEGTFKQAGVDPAFIYAYRKTGLLVVSENMDFLTYPDLKQWQEAVEEFREANAPSIAEPVSESEELEAVHA